MQTKKGSDPAEQAGGSGMSRRSWLSSAAMVGLGAAFVTSLSAPAQAKQKPDQVKYQDSPKGEAKCESCSQFEAPEGCKVVDGKISPNGWCQLYSKKG